VHGYFLLANDAKMAKSAGEFLRLATLVERGCDPLAFRYLCLTGHYRTQLNFTFDALDAAATGLTRMRTGFHALAAGRMRCRTPRRSRRSRARQRRSQHAARARRRMGGAARRPARRDQARHARALRRRVRPRLSEWRPQRQAIPAEIEALAQARLAARKAKNWTEADRLRGALHAAGWEMEDRADGYALKPRA
jgi:cysteinyl-tRNA synthetase